MIKSELKNPVLLGIRTNDSFKSEENLRLIRLKEIKKVVSDFNKFFLKNPEIFFYEYEVRNALFRKLVSRLVINKSLRFHIEMESSPSSLSNIRYDIAIYDDNRNLLSAFEIKYDLQSCNRSLELVKRDIEKLLILSGERTFIKGFFIFYNHFTDYQTFLERIKKIKTDKVSIIVISSTNRGIRHFNKRMKRIITKNRGVGSCSSDDTRERIILFLKKRGSATITEIYRLGGSSNRINYASLNIILGVLEKEGRISIEIIGKNIKLVRWLK